MHRDPLIPPIVGFEITEEEQRAIDYALTLKDAWNLEQNSMDCVRHILKPLRVRIKAFHLARQNNLCCYCRTNLYGVGVFMVDREHIIPKSHCKELTYVMTNLSVACKRCNMEIKKNKTNLFVHAQTINQHHLDETAYRIIHPNFEKYEDFIARIQVQVGTKQLVKFVRVKESEKSDYMFEFFKLRDLEINAFDDAQGLTSTSLSQIFLLDALKYESENQPERASQILELLTENIKAQATTFKHLTYKPEDYTLEAFNKKLGRFNKSFIANIGPTLQLPSPTGDE